MFGICSKLTMKAPERLYQRCFGVLIANFKQISMFCSGISIVQFEQVNAV